MCFAPRGMRPDPFPSPHPLSPNARPRSQVNGEYHADGEIYAAAMWRLKELYEASGLTALDLLQDWFGGLLYTVTDPSFEDMRNGMRVWLSRAPYDGTARTCLVWRAFAQFGIGVGAWGGVVNGAQKVTESFTVPATCP